ncbi:MAG: RNA polymerase sigma factor [Candidatus Zambryskibacteria bacterium]
MERLEKTFLDSYNVHSDEIFRFIFFKLSDREKAKDILQDVFMKTWLYMSKNAKIENIRAFLYKTASNAVIDEYRRQSRKDNLNESLETLSEESGYDPGSDDTDLLIDKIDSEQAMKFIKELPEVYAETLFLRYTENKSISEIADITGRSDNAISVQLNRGIKKLKMLIAEKYGSR